MLFGFGVLVYYMDRNFMVNNSQVMINNLNSNHKTQQQPNAQSRVLNTRVRRIQNSHPDAQTPLPPYLVEELKTWSQPVSKDNPKDWPGEYGTAVTLDKDEEKDYKTKFDLNKFNLIASDKIALNRSIPDFRLDGCKTKTYSKLLPATSIIIVFHNEAWSTLLRTVHSVIKYTPKELIEEIILVDDASDRDYLGKKLDDAMANLPLGVKGKVLRMETRSGLIKARLRGAFEAKGPILTFLDAHCECTIQWLEPLLERILEDRTRVVCPIIDVISDENFEYIPASDMTYGGFNWKLNFRWYRVPQREVDRRNGDRTLPVRTPTMAGGLFSIDKEYFNYLGKYDENMTIWGGENLELSFRIWMCGGTLEIATCSHVGHVFRKSTPYTFPGGTSKIVNHNNARVAEVWLDEWQDFYFAMNPAAMKVDRGDTTSRKQLRKDLKCKSFRWYLENIYPESQMPLDYYNLGEIRNEETGSCLDNFGRKSNENIGYSKCHNMGGNQVFAYTKRDQIMIDDACVDASVPASLINQLDEKSSSHKHLVMKFGTNKVEEKLRRKLYTVPIKLFRCHNMGGNQAWKYNFTTKQIVHMNSNLCLDKPVDAKDPTLPVLNICDLNLKSQRWILNSNFKWQVDKQSPQQENNNNNDNSNNNNEVESDM